MGIVEYYVTKEFMRILKCIFLLLAFLLGTQNFNSIFACKSTYLQDVTKKLLLTEKQLLEMELFNAVSTGNLPKAQQLIPHVNVDARDCDGRTLLMVAVKGGSRRIVETLIGSGATIGLVDNDGKTALMMALEQRNPDIVEALIHSSGAVICKTCAAQMGLRYYETPITRYERSNQARATPYCKYFQWMLCGVCGTILVEWCLISGCTIL